MQQLSGTNYQGFIKGVYSYLKSCIPKNKINVPAGNLIFFFFFQSIAVECFREMLSINRESYWGQTELF